MVAAARQSLMLIIFIFYFERLVYSFGLCSVVNPIKHFTLVNDASRVVISAIFWSKVENYECKIFIRLATVLLFIFDYRKTFKCLQIESWSQCHESIVE